MCSAQYEGGGGALGRVLSLEVILSAILLPTFVIFNFPHIFQLQNFSEYQTRYCCLPSVFLISLTYFNFNKFKILDTILLLTFVNFNFPTYFNCKTFQNIEHNIAGYLCWFHFSLHISIAKLVNPKFQYLFLQIVWGELKCVRVWNICLSPLCSKRIKPSVNSEKSA